MKITSFVAALVSIFPAALSSATLTLTDETWLESVHDKSVFIMFEESEVRPSYRAQRENDII